MSTLTLLRFQGWSSGLWSHKIPTLEINLVWLNSQWESSPRLPASSESKAWRGSRSPLPLLSPSYLRASTGSGSTEDRLREENVADRAGRRSSLRLRLWYRREEAGGAGASAGGGMELSSSSDHGLFRVYNNHTLGPTNCLKGALFFDLQNLSVVRMRKGLWRTWYIFNKMIKSRISHNDHNCYWC